MDGSREVLATPAKGFLVDMGRWRKVASIDKVLHNEVGLEWKIDVIKPLDGRGRRFLVEATYEPPKCTTEVRSYVPAVLGEELKAAAEEEKEAEPVMGVDVFSKTQMRKVQAMLDEEHRANRTLAEELSQSRDENKALLAELEKARRGGTQAEKPQVKKPRTRKVKAPSFAREIRMKHQSDFLKVRNCALRRLVDLEWFDKRNVKAAFAACGATEYGINPTRAVGPTLANCMRYGYVVTIGMRDGNKIYRFTKKGKDLLEVKEDERN